MKNKIELEKIKQNLQLVNDANEKNIEQTNIKTIPEENEIQPLAKSNNLFFYGNFGVSTLNPDEINNYNDEDLDEAIDYFKSLGYNASGSFEEYDFAYNFEFGLGYRYIHTSNVNFQFSLGFHVINARLINVNLSLNGTSLGEVEQKLRSYLIIFSLI